MVNFGPLAAEIVSLVWGTPPNFNCFRVLAALLHGTPAAGFSQTLRRGTRNGITELPQTAPLIFGWAAITLGIGPHSSQSALLSISGGSMVDIQSPTAEIRRGKKKKKEEEEELEMWANAQPMVALPNIGGALCSTPQSLADAHY